MAEVEATGKGFLNSVGNLKDKKTLAKEDAQASKNKEADSAATKTSVSDKNISNALGAVKTKFSEQANSFVGTLNKNDENLKKADENVKKQLEVAKELKAAIKDKDQQKIEDRKSELRELQKQKDELAKEIEAENQAQDVERKRKLSLGNQERAAVEVKKVKVEKTKEEDLDSAESVERTIDSLKAEKESIKTQREDIKVAKKEVNVVVKEVKSELEKIEKNSINSINAAQKAAEDVSKEIIKAGSQASLVSNIDEEVVKSLVNG